jgi:diguanylate cyclase (GGDEF)-like protein
MLNLPVYSALTAQLPMAQAGQLLLVTGIAFIVITLIASTYRFHRMIQLDESALPTAEDCNDFFFIQVTRYLSKINRSSSGFGVLIIQFLSDASTQQRPVQEALLHRLQNEFRHTCDKVCLFRDDCVAVIIDTEEEQVPAAVERIVDTLSRIRPEIPGMGLFRAGASRFPMHGLNSRLIIDIAAEAMEAADFGNQPLHLAPPPKDETENDGKEEPVGELSKDDKSSAIDPLTGVLKPAVVGSYLRKYLAELRRRKEPTSLFCINISRVNRIIELHGPDAADDVTAGVSRIIQKLTRDSDLIGRYQQYDFLLLAPCTLPQAEQIAQRLRDAVQKEVFISQGKRIKAVLSVGIAAYPEHGRLLRDLFRGAFRALEVIQEWNTAACLVYDPKQHMKKAVQHETRR